uniref:Peroxisomal membrane protein PEX21 n=1 Tax=Anthurium amnicola TaxID=1678845 RepID=A0A1D1ZF51_9ARAE
MSEAEEELSREPPEEGSSSASASTMGRVMLTLMGARPRHLQSAISKLGPSPSRSSSGALLDESLCFLWRHVEDAAKKEEQLDHILIPIIEHFKEPTYSKQVLILIIWLCGNELLLQAILSNLTEIIMRKKDHFIAFSWCTFVRSLVELSVDQLFDEGKQGHRLSLLKILCRSIPCLVSITCRGSTLVDGFELPTRLSVAAADCTLVLSEALANEALNSEAGSSGIQFTDSRSKSKLFNLVPLSENEKNHDQTRVTHVSEDLETVHLLWHHLNELIILVEKLQAWSRKSLPLREKGLRQVLKWLKELKRHYVSVQDEAGSKLLMSGALLLASCWKHYGLLLRLVNQRFFKHSPQMLDQYISALEFYTQLDVDGDPGKLASSIETRKFFLNCMALLCGRLHGEQLETVISESGAKLVNVIISQLKCDHQDLVEVTLSILRAIMFRTDFSSGSSAAHTHQVEATLPLLLSLLDERDSTAKTVILLIAEFCYRNMDGQDLKEILKHLASGTHYQKKNAVDVIRELFSGYSDSVNKISPSLWQDIAKHLLECLGDEELIDHVEASNLFLYCDSNFVLPQLVQLSYSENEKVQFSAAQTLVSVLRHHGENFNVIELLLDSLSDILRNFGTTGKSVQCNSTLLLSGSKLDIDHVLKLTPKWSESVENWGVLIDKLIDKMFLNPSNAVLVRFMSYLSEPLAEAGDFVLHRVLIYMQEQDMDEDWVSNRSHASYASEDASRLRDYLLSRLCPLLMLRVIPLRVFDNLKSPALYGGLCSQESLKAKGDMCASKNDSISALLFNRAFGLFEYEDVRKLAAELCGRLHPHVLLPVVGYHLGCASECQDTLKLKACLFAVCTSLVARGRESGSHPSMSGIREAIDFVLSWPSVDADEVSKAQHGCIDCLALMICAEVQSSESWVHSSNNTTLREPRDHAGPGAITSSVLACVIQRLTCDEKGIALAEPDTCARQNVSPLQQKLPLPNKLTSNASSPPTFRLCMANVLISACQKVASSGRYVLAIRTLPALIFSIETIVDQEIRAACLQVLFSAVYHLKSSVLPYSSELIKLSIKALERGSEKEKIAAAKLLASLMASEDEIVDSISASLLEAKLVLARVSMTDSSKDLRQLCEKLLACVTSPPDNVFPGT